MDFSNFKDVIMKMPYDTYLLCKYEKNTTTITDIIKTSRNFTEISRLFQAYRNTFKSNDSDTSIEFLKKTRHVIVIYSGMYEFDTHPKGIIMNKEGKILNG